MRVFLTGGTGLLGNTILRQLEAEDHFVASLVRAQTKSASPKWRSLDGLKTKPVIADLLDADSIDAAVKDSDVVIHAAGMIHLGWHRLDESMRINRDGTRILADACLRHDRKLVHVGTVDTLALGSLNKPADESTPISDSNRNPPTSYVQSKIAGVEVVREAVLKGLRAVIVHPGFMLGPWDWTPSSGRMILEVGRTWRPFAPSGGCSVCDSRDVAAATIAAIDRGGDDGRQYILAGHNMSYLELWKRIAKAMNVRSPLLKTGPAVLWTVGSFGDVMAAVTGREGDLNSGAIQMSRKLHWYDSSRAIAELGYQIRDFDETLNEAVQWIRTHHLTPPQKSSDDSVNNSPSLRFPN